MVDATAIEFCGWTKWGRFLSFLISTTQSLRAVPQVVQSVYYILPRLAEWLVGASELSYRIFSVAAMAGALLPIVSLAGRLVIPPRSGSPHLAAWPCMNLTFKRAMQDRLRSALSFLALHYGCLSDGWIPRADPSVSLLVLRLLRCGGFTFCCGRSILRSQFTRSWSASRNARPV